MKSHCLLLVILLTLGSTSSFAMTRGPSGKAPATQDASPLEIKKETGKTQLSPKRNTKIVTPTVPVKKNR